MINVIEAIEEKLKAQKDEIFFKDLQIKDLKASLEELQKMLDRAETERDKAIYELKRIKNNNGEREKNA